MGRSRAVHYWVMAVMVVGCALLVEVDAGGEQKGSGEGEDHWLRLLEEVSKIKQKALDEAVSDKHVKQESYVKAFHAWKESKSEQKRVEKEKALAEFADAQSKLELLFNDAKAVQDWIEYAERMVGERINAYDKAVEKDDRAAIDEAKSKRDKASKKLALLKEKIGELAAKYPDLSWARWVETGGLLSKSRPSLAGASQPLEAKNPKKVGGVSGEAEESEPGEK